MLGNESFGQGEIIRVRREAAMRRAAGYPRPLYPDALNYCGDDAEGDLCGPACVWVALPSTFGGGSVEITVLRAANKSEKEPKKPYTIKEAVDCLGWLRWPKQDPSDGHPGIKTIWIGLMELHILMA
jgi:hypothetical protein